MLGRPWRMTGYLPLHINRDFEVDLYKAMEVFVSAKTQLGQIVDNFKKFLSIKVIKIVLDSILYETLKWPQIAPFCISSNKKSQTPSPSQELWRAHYLSSATPLVIISNTSCYIYILLISLYTYIQWYIYHKEQFYSSRQKLCLKRGICFDKIITSHPSRWYIRQGCVVG